MNSFVSAYLYGTVECEPEPFRIMSEGSDEVDFVTPELPGRDVGATSLTPIAEDVEDVTETLLAATTSQLSRTPVIRASISQTDSTYHDASDCVENTTLTGWDCLYTKEDYLLWPPKDITEIDKGNYKKVVERDAFINRDILRHELHHVCRMNFVGRVEMLCELLALNGISLVSEDLLGQLSETPLHVAIIYNSTDTARILIRYGGRDLVLKRYGHKDYDGTNCLHAAVAKNNPELIDIIMEILDESDRKQLLHNLATGTYFRRKYSSGLPLTLAAFMGNKEIVGKLIEYGAQVDASDQRNGDSIMHALVQQSLHHSERAQDMYRFVMTSPLVQAWWLKRRGLQGLNMTCSEYRCMKSHLLGLTNNAGLTPLTLAASTGAIDMCAAILKTDDVYRFPQWKCGPVEFSFCDVTEVDSTLSGRTGVLDFFLYSNSDDRLSFCRIGPIRQLLKTKWSRYKFLFFLWFVFHFLLMVAFSVCASMRHAPTEIHINDNGTTGFVTFSELTISWRILLMATEIALLGAAIAYLIGEIYDIALFIIQLLQKAKIVKKKHGDLDIDFIWISMRPDIFRTCLLIFSLAIISVPFLRIQGSVDGETLAVAIAGITGWLFLLFFTRALKNIGMFTVMLEKLFIGDFSYFTVVFMLVISGFSLGFFTLFHPVSPKGDGAHVPERVSSLGTTMFTLFSLMCGIDEFDILHDPESKLFARFIFIFFVLMANILLLNMLIAAMNDTYIAVSGQKEHLWMKIRGKSVDLLERHLPRVLRPSMNLQRRVVTNHRGRKKQLWLLPVEEMTTMNKK